MAANKDKTREKYLEFQMLLQQLQQLQENIGTLEKHILDLNNLNENVDSVSKLAGGEEILVPLGSGIFLRSVLKDSRNFVMNVGANVCIDKTSDEAKAVILKQSADVNGVLAQMQEEAVRTVTRIQELQEELQKAKGKEKQ